ncbi:trichohyalin-like [Mizuhopecten yessoensis]|uniref:trichohyalin-like n=1 Tax=Mizuhopecten yessoensis TaxID=6573 RepID=UPI000B45F793|nr:trichohyalin-like [Mizuhopecten yessoensis]
MATGKGGNMGGFFSTDKPETGSVIRAADSAAEEVIKTQDEIQKKFKELRDVIGKQNENVETLTKTKARTMDLFNNMQRDDNTGPTHSKKTCTGSDPICEHSKEIKDLKKRMKELRSTLVEKKKEFEKEKQTIATERKRSQEEISGLESDKSRLQMEKTQLESNESRLQMEKQQLESNESRLQMEKQQLESEKSRLQTEKQQLESEQSRLQMDKQQLESEKKSNLHKIQDLENNIKQAEEHIRLAKQKKVRVSLYSGNHTTLMEASAELNKMLCFHWEALGILATVEPCLDPKAHTGTTPLIILCINASRLGTDVSNATQNIHCDQSVAVVILHHKELHALPSQPSEKLLVGAQYRQLGAIVDIAFLKTKGLYACDMNEKALDKLTAFISNFIQQG